MYRVRPTIMGLAILALLVGCEVGCNNPLANLKGDELLEMCAAIVPPCEPCPPQKQCPPAVDPPPAIPPPVDPPEPPRPPAQHEKATWGCAPKGGFYLIDDARGNACGQVKVVGEWQTHQHSALVGGTMQYRDKSASDDGRVTFTPAIKKTGTYEVWASWISSHAAAREALILVSYAGGQASAIVGQYEPDMTVRWRKIGTWRFKKGNKGTISIIDRPGPASASERIDAVGLKLVK